MLKHNSLAVESFITNNFWRFVFQLITVISEQRLFRHRLRTMYSMFKSKNNILLRSTIAEL